MKLRFLNFVVAGSLLACAENSGLPPTPESGLDADYYDALPWVDRPLGCEDDECIDHIAYGDQIFDESATVRAVFTGAPYVVGPTGTDSNGFASITFEETIDLQNRVHEAHVGNTEHRVRRSPAADRRAPRVRDPGRAARSAYGYPELTAERKAKVLGLNAARLLCLPPPSPWRAGDSPTCDDTYEMASSYVWAPKPPLRRPTTCLPSC